MQCPNCKNELMNVNGRYVCVECGTEVAENDLNQYQNSLLDGTVSEPTEPPTGAFDEQTATTEPTEVSTGSEEVMTPVQEPTVPVEETQAVETPVVEATDAPTPELSVEDMAEQADFGSVPVTPEPVETKGNEDEPNIAEIVSAPAETLPASEVAETATFTSSIPEPPVQETVLELTPEAPATPADNEEPATQDTVEEMVAPVSDSVPTEEPTESVQPATEEAAVAIEPDQHSEVEAPQTDAAVPETSAPVDVQIETESTPPVPETPVETTQPDFSKDAPIDPFEVAEASGPGSQQDPNLYQNPMFDNTGNMPSSIPMEETTTAAPAATVMQAELQPTAEPVKEVKNATPTQLLILLIIGGLLFVFFIVGGTVAYQMLTKPAVIKPTMITADNITNDGTNSTGNPNVKNNPGTNNEN